MPRGIHHTAPRADTTMRRMRRLAVLTVAIVLLCGIPQAMAQRRFQFGGKVGPSFTDIAQDEDDGGTYHRRIAAAGGGFLWLPLAGPVGVQVEALTTPKGTRLEEPDSGLSQTLMLRYVEVPYLLRIDAPGQEPGGCFLFGGGYFAVRISAKVQISSSTTVSSAAAATTRATWSSGTTTAGWQAPATISAGSWSWRGATRGGCRT